jgi:protease IV
VALKRGVGVVLSLLGFAVLVSAAGFLLLHLVVSAEPAVPERATLVLRPSGALDEVLPDDVLRLVRGRERHTVRGYVEAIRKAKVDRRITGLVLAPRGLNSPFWAKVQDIRDAVIDFRESGKPVVAFLEASGDQAYYLATAADRIVLVPTADLDLKGLALYELFLRGTLDWIGAYPDFLHIGGYKTAINLYTERTFTDAQREMSISLTNDQFEQLVRGIADGRGKTEDEVRQLIDQGPFVADAAYASGLVDELAYEDELEELVPAHGGGDSLVELADYARVSDRSAGIRRGGTIALINAVGTIVSGRSAFDPVNGPLVGSETIIEHIRAARANRSVRAIVLRIDSPGGSSVASDVIWRELMLVKQGDNPLPLIVSMSDLAASGGYYLAMAGDVVVAQPGTLTGSIGIFTGKFVTESMFDKLGANLEATSRGRHAEIYSPNRPFTPSERQKILTSMQVFYDQFVEKAAEARQTTPERIAAIAQGRVWTGRQAREVGLVDQVGGLYTAIAVAKQRARIPDDEEPTLLVYPPRRTLFDVVTEGFPGADARAERSAAQAVATLIGTREGLALAALMAPARLFRPGEGLALMPHVILRQP